MATNNSPMIMHSTYFKLKSGSSTFAPKSYMEACREYLSESEGMLQFWVGELASDVQRPVSDSDFDVAMHQVFQNKDAFDHYNSKDPRHEQFVSEVNRWAPGTARRVFDSFLSQFVNESPSSGSPADLPRLMHSIYFSLTDKSEDSRAMFIDICVKLLSGHPGESGFAIGEVANPLNREINVVNYDVAIDMLWDNKKSYDDYLKSPSHDDFIPATEGMVKTTQVIDSYLQNEPAA